MQMRLTTIAALLFQLVLWSAVANLPQTQQQETTPSTSPFADVDRLLQLGKFTEAITRLEAMQIKRRLRKVWPANWESPITKRTTS